MRKLAAAFAGALLLGALSAAPAAAVDPEPLAWAAPTLVNPITIQLSNSNHSLNRLDPAKDYRLVMPSTPLDVGTGRLSITGGHNIVLVGGEITGSGVDGTIRATGQTGTLHVEGLYVSGSSLQEGLQFQNEGAATVQLQNIRFDQVSGSYAGHHADLVQYWGGGPKVFRIDRLTGSTNYQGFMMQDYAGLVNGVAPGWDWRRINIHHVGSAGWTIYDGSPRLSQFSVSDIYLDGTAGNGVYRLGKNGTMPGVYLTNPPAGDFVPAGVAGLNYGK
jgi:hypothetical protein